MNCISQNICYCVTAVGEANRCDAVAYQDQDVPTLLSLCQLDLTAASRGITLSWKRNMQMEQHFITLGGHTMKQLRIVLVVLMGILLPAAYLSAHCQVPCGIYDDDARFTEMREDQTTIAKAIGQIQELSATHDPQGHNQLARWVATKEAHATNTQQIIAQYFMAQRIQSSDAAYEEKLTAAHSVLVAAMQCKQSADPVQAEALQAAIEAFQQVYNLPGSVQR